MGRRRARCLAWSVSLAVGGALAVCVAPSSADSSAVYCLGRLPAGYSCAGPGTYSGIVDPHLYTDHTACASLAKGYGGYNPHPTGSNTVAIACGTGYQSEAIGTGGASYHGAVLNQNGSTPDNIATAWIEYGLIVV
jgi:hypothetical protein